MTRALLFGRDADFQRVLRGTLNRSTMRLLAAGLMAGALGGSLALAQTPALPLGPVASAPASTVASPAPTLVPVTPVLTATAPAVTDTAASFVGIVNADRVYVRSGPGVNYYEIGQLSKGDTLQVVGQRPGWYMIAPPAGSFCYISKDLVDVGPDGKDGTVKGEYVNVRAASAIHPASDYVVLTVARKGAKLTVLGTVDKYYKIVPPEKAYVFVASQFVAPAPGGTAYVAPGLHAAGVTPTATHPAPDVVENITLHPPVAPVPDGATTEPASTEPRQVVVPPLPPTTMYSADAADRYSALNTKLQAEFQKPVAARELGALLEDFQALLTMPGISPSIKQNTQARIAVIQKTIAFQTLVKTQSADAEALSQQREALQKQYGPIEEQIKASEASAPPLAEGRLQTSSVQSRYVLVNPTTGRVAAYLDPNSDVDLTKLLGSYVAVRGTVQSGAGLAVKTIKVHTATLLPDPTSTGASAPQP